ncbi:hypothetical protein EXN66_Car001426 [Channa argus]|uniref:Uncharacterized protein n=1 Tax=Channa argus TaxID=215402 RepID=A0A6G1R022_CHAAH|nr:hypothetical protein EXN66_Car001426 [Channa argus]
MCVDVKECMHMLMDDFQPLTWRPLENHSALTDRCGKRQRKKAFSKQQQKSSGVRSSFSKKLTGQLLGTANAALSFNFLLSCCCGPALLYLDQRTKQASLVLNEGICGGEKKQSMARHSDGKRRDTLVAILSEKTFLNQNRQHITCVLQFHIPAHTGKMKAKNRDQSLSDSRELDGSYDQLTDRNLSDQRLWLVVEGPIFPARRHPRDLHVMRVVEAKVQVLSFMSAVVLGEKHSVRNCAIIALHVMEAKQHECNASKIKKILKGVSVKPYALLQTMCGNLQNLSLSANIVVYIKAYVWSSLLKWSLVSDCP